MKNKIRIAALIMTAVLASTGTASGAAGFDTLDSKTAVAGTSVILSDYFEANEDAAKKIAAALGPVLAVNEENGSLYVGGSDLSASETGEETLYSKAVTGVVGVEGVLNVRKAPSTLSDIVECAVRGSEITVIGERVVNDNLWYKVCLHGIEGYVAGNYVAFGEEAEILAKDIAKEQSGEASLPGSFSIPDDISWMNQDIQNTLKFYTNEINYCISTNYPTEEARGNYIGMYSILLYLMENFQGIMDIANEYGLTATYNAAGAALSQVDNSRVQLSVYTETTDTQYVESIRSLTPESTAATETQPVVWVPEQAQPASPATQPAAPATQPATQPAAPATQPAAPATQPATQPAAPATQPTAAPVVPSDIGSQLANFAAQWVGQINYVWGGNDFRAGGGVDCSHFTYNVYLHYGLVSGYSTSGGQRSWGRAVDISQIQPGDLVCYDGHVAIYYGNGTIVHAPAPGHMIEIGSLYVLPVVGVRRLY